VVAGARTLRWSNGDLPIGNRHGARSPAQDVIGQPARNPRRSADTRADRL